MLRMHKNWLLVGWAYAKFVSRWLSMRKNLLLVSYHRWKLGYSLAKHLKKSFCCTLSSSSVPPVTCFSVPFSYPLPNALCPLSRISVPCVPCLTSLFFGSRPKSPVLRLCSVAPVLCFMSHVSVPCLVSSVPRRTSLFLVSRPLSPVSCLCSLSSVLCPLSHVSVPCLPSSVSCDLSPVSHPPFSVP